LDVSSSLLRHVDPSFRALAGRLEFTVRHHTLNQDSLSLGASGRSEGLQRREQPFFACLCFYPSLHRLRIPLRFHLSSGPRLPFYDSTNARSFQTLNSKPREDPAETLARSSGEGSNITLFTPNPKPKNITLNHKNAPETTISASLGLTDNSVGVR